MSNDIEEPDWNSILDEDDEGTNCWVCTSCGQVEADRPAWGGQCPKCGCQMEEEYL